MTSYVRYYHKKNKTSGQVWQGRFKSFMVEQESNLLYKLVADNSLGVLPLVVHGLKDKKTA